MSASRTICLRCASHLSLAAGRQGQCALSLARFSSLPDALAAPAERVDRGHPMHVPARSGRKNPGYPRPQQKPSKQRQSLGKTKPTGDEALALFNDIVGGKMAMDKAASTSITEGSPNGALVDYELAAKLNELDTKGSNLTVAEQFGAFRQLWPHINAHPRPLPKHLYKSSLNFISKLASRVVKEGYVNNAVCKGIISVYHSLRQWNLVVKNDLILALCQGLIREENSTRRETLANELVDIWKAISQMRRASQKGQPLRFVLPNPQEVLEDIDEFHRKKVKWKVVRDNDTSRALAAIIIQFNALEAQALVPALLATATVLTSTDLVPARVLNEAAPLLGLIPVALQRANVDEAYIDSIFPDAEGTGTFEPLRHWVQEQWPVTARELNLKVAAWRTILPQQQPVRSGKYSTKTLAQFYKQLRTASKTNNTGAILSIWRDLKTELAEQPALMQELGRDTEFLDFWQYVWCAVRKPAMLAETQALMQEVGLQPTVKTYTAMMHGWKAGKDLDKINALWSLIVQSNLRLDTHIWTERISGLIELGSIEDGLHSLAEMMALWKKASKTGSVKAGDEHAVRPTIEVVNAAFSGLIRKDRHAALEVLNWAARHDIQPDISTYNILIRESFRDRGISGLRVARAAPATSSEAIDTFTEGDAQDLLRSMKERGVEPNEATFTIILEEVLGVLAHASAAEQVKAVKHVMSDIAAAGLRPNLETYGKMLHSIAILPNSADEAIEAVIRRMKNNGYTQMTPHMVLILIKRVLRRYESGSINSGSAPIVALLNDHGYTSIDTGDQRLWENVLSAYAVTGDTVRAMVLYDEMHNNGRPVINLSSLRDLLLALLDAQQEHGDFYHAAARRVVGNTLAIFTERQEDVRNPDRQWRHHFWVAAYDKGLLDKATAPPGLQRMLEQ